MRQKDYLQACIIITISLLLLFLQGCAEEPSVDKKVLEGDNWAEKLGFPKGKKVIILHADDAGMCDEANIATIAYLENNQIQGAAIMVPCPFAEDIINWAVKNPDEDMGLHITHTSEWKTYRWGPVTDPEFVPGLIDPDGKLWHEVEDVLKHATAEEVERELRSQIDKAIALGMKPSHIDTHMGTLYGSADYLQVFLKVAEEYNIPANAIDLSVEQVANHFREAGYPIDDRGISLLENYKLPKLDFFASVPNGKNYEEKRDNFFELVKTLPPGLTEIIFHPSVLTDNLKTITNSWQQRVWEAELFSDPVVNEFFEKEGIIFTDWKEIMQRFLDAS